jgi:ATP synthase F1 gamma subunit
MPNLKEIRARINSVASTGKITSAMKMVSAAKLKKSEGMTLNFLPYRNKLSEALSNYLGSLEEEVSIPLASKHEVKRDPNCLLLKQRPLRRVQLQCHQAVQEDIRQLRQATWRGSGGGYIVWQKDQ